MKILIDGYNLIWAVPELRKKLLNDERGTNLEEGRKELLHYLEIYQRAHPKLKITVVFDSKEEIFPYPALPSRIKVLYSNGETADNLIEKIVKDEKNETLVVTSDNELKRRVKEKGAEVIGSSTFFERISPGKKSICHKELNSLQKNFIEEELKRTYRIK